MKYLMLLYFNLYCSGGCIYCIGAVSYVGASVYTLGPEYCSVSYIGLHVYFPKYGNISRSSGSSGYSIGGVLGVVNTVSLSFPFFISMPILLFPSCNIVLFIF